MTDSEIRSILKDVYSKLKCKASCSSVGTPSLPFNSIQYNNNGAFFGDALFTRDPVTGVTNIQTIFADGTIGDIAITNDLISGGSNGIQFGQGNLITGESALVFVGDNTPGGGVPFTVGFQVTGAAGESIDFTSDLTNGLHLDYANGTIISQIQATPTLARIHWDDGLGNDIIVTTDVNGVTIDAQNGKVKVTNVPTYANDAAALVGGLTTGQLYKTTVLGSTFLKIVP